jgi:flagellar biosynthesis protein FliQ
MPPVAPDARTGSAGGVMDVIEGILKAALMVIFLVVVVGLLAALFMIIFGIATGIDENIQS